jgi:hypothetical protein
MGSQSKAITSIKKIIKCKGPNVQPNKYCIWTVEHPKPCKRTGYIHSIICQRGASTIGDLEKATLLGKPRTTERWRSRVSQPTPYKKRMHPSFVGNVLWTSASTPNTVVSKKVFGPRKTNPKSSRRCLEQDIFFQDIHESYDDRALSIVILHPSGKRLQIPIEIDL